MVDETKYRGLTIQVWRTDDPTEGPDDDPDATEPFELGDWYCGIVEWHLQSPATVGSSGLAHELAVRAIDAVLDVGQRPQEALRLGDGAPQEYDPSQARRTLNRRGLQPPRFSRCSLESEDSFCCDSSAAPRTRMTQQSNAASPIDRAPLQTLRSVRRWALPKNF